MKKTTTPNASATSPVWIMLPTSPGSSGGKLGWTSVGEHDADTAKAREATPNTINRGDPLVKYFFDFLHFTKAFNCSFKFKAFC